jgi:hypothetical protein
LGGDFALRAGGGFGRLVGAARDAEGHAGA